MSMIVAGGFGEEHKNKTFECLQCGHVEHPINGKKQEIRTRTRTKKPAGLSRRVQF
jgi:Zn ribbon nucleic-acid-binding protein